MAGFLDQVTGPATLVGYSRGGSISFLLAAVHPELVRGIYTIDVTPYFLENPAVRELPFVASVFGAGVLVAQFREEQRDLDWLTDRLGSVGFGSNSTLLELLEADVVAAWSAELAQDDPGIFGSKASFDRPDVTADQICESLPGPIHIAYGDPELGNIVTADELNRVAGRATTASSTHFPGLGHGIHYHAHDAVARDLQVFLKANNL